MFMLRWLVLLTHLVAFTLIIGFFLSLDDTFLPGLGVYDQAFILVLNSRYKQEQDGMTLDG